MARILISTLGIPDTEATERRTKEPRRRESNMVDGKIKKTDWDIHLVCLRDISHIDAYGGGIFLTFISTFMAHVFNSHTRFKMRFPKV